MSNKVSSRSPFAPDAPVVQEKKEKKTSEKFSTEAPQGQAKTLVKRILQNSINEKIPNLENPITPLQALKLISLQETFIMDVKKAPSDTRMDQTATPTPQTQPFTLSILDKLLVKEIFNTWHLNNHSMCGLEILGLDIHTSICNLNLAKKLKKNLLENFAMSIFHTHIRLIREQDQSVPMNAYTDKYILSQEATIKKLATIKDSLSLLAAMENLKVSLKKIGAKINLLTTLLQSQPMLLLEPTKSIEGSERLNYADTNSREKNLNDLEKYINYYTYLFSNAVKEGCFSIDSKPIFDICKEQIHLLKSQFDEEQVEKSMNTLCALFKSSESLISATKNNTMAVVEGELNHEGWLSLHGLPIPEKTKSQEEFTQQMTQQFVSFNFLDHALLMIYSQLLSHVITPGFPKFISIFNHTSRLSFNIMSCPDILEKTRSNYVKDPIFSSFQKYLLEQILPIEQLFDKAIVSFNKNAFDEKTFRYLNESLSPYRWISFFKNFEHLPLLKTAKAALVEVPGKLIKFLKESLHNYAEQIDQEVFKNHIKQICFQNTLFLINIMMLIEDIEVISNQLPQKSWISDELLNIIFLDGLDDIFPQTPNEATEKSKENKIEKITSPCKESQDLSHSPSNPPQSKKLEKPPNKTTTKSLPTQQPKPKSFPPLPRQEFLRETKTDKLLKMLENSGFIVVRQKKHKWLQGPNGEITCLPNHRIQKLGLVQAVYKQATQSKDEKK